MITTLKLGKENTPHVADEKHFIERKKFVLFLASENNHNIRLLKVCEEEKVNHHDDESISTLMYVHECLCIMSISPIMHIFCL